MNKLTLFKLPFSTQTRDRFIDKAVIENYKLTSFTDIEQSKTLSGKKVKYWTMVPASPGDAVLTFFNSLPEFEKVFNANYVKIEFPNEKNRFQTKEVYFFMVGVNRLLKENDGKYNFNIELDAVATYGNKLLSAMDKEQASIFLKSAHVNQFEKQGNKLVSNIFNELNKSITQRIIKSKEFINQNFVQVENKTLPSPFEYIKNLDIMKEFLSTEQAFKKNDLKFPEDIKTYWVNRWKRFFEDLYGRNAPWLAISKSKWINSKPAEYKAFTANQLFYLWFDENFKYLAALYTFYFLKVNHATEDGYFPYISYLLNPSELSYTQNGKKNKLKFLFNDQNPAQRKKYTITLPFFNQNKTRITKLSDVTNQSLYEKQPDGTYKNPFVYSEILRVIAVRGQQKYKKKPFLNLKSFKELPNNKYKIWATGTVWLPKDEYMYAQWNIYALTNPAPRDSGASTMIRWKLPEDMFLMYDTELEYDGNNNTIKSTSRSNQKIVNWITEDISNKSTDKVEWWYNFYDGIKKGWLTLKYYPTVPMKGWLNIYAKPYADIRPTTRPDIAELLKHTWLYKELIMLWPDTAQQPYSKEFNYEGNYNMLFDLSEYRSVITAILGKDLSEANSVLQIPYVKPGVVKAPLASDPTKFSYTLSYSYKQILDNQLANDKALESLEYGIEKHVEKFQQAPEILNAASQDKILGIFYAQQPDFWFEFTPQGNQEAKKFIDELVKEKFYTGGYKTNYATTYDPTDKINNIIDELLIRVSNKKPLLIEKQVEEVTAQKTEWKIKYHFILEPNKKQPYQTVEWTLDALDENSIYASLKDKNIEDLKENKHAALIYAPSLLNYLKFSINLKHGGGIEILPFDMLNDKVNISHQNTLTKQEWVLETPYTNNQTALSALLQVPYAQTQLELTKKFFNNENIVALEKLNLQDKILQLAQQKEVFGEQAKQRQLDQSRTFSIINTILGGIGAVVGGLTGGGVGTAAALGGAGYAASSAQSLYGHSLNQDVLDKEKFFNAKGRALALTSRDLERQTLQNLFSRDARTTGISSGIENDSGSKLQDKFPKDQLYLSKSQIADKDLFQILKYHSLNGIQINENVEFLKREFMNRENFNWLSFTDLILETEIPFVFLERLKTEFEIGVRIWNKKVDYKKLNWQRGL